MSDTSAPPLTLVEFLTARLDEEEAIARRDPQRWIAGRMTDYLGGSRWASADDALDSANDIGRLMAAEMRGEIVAHPARVLADIAAKRAIINLHEHYVEQKREGGKYSDTWKPDEGCVTCHWDNDCGCIEDSGYPCDTVKLLASLYRGHPQWREEWE